jgi:hypothetical protein
MLRSFNRLAGVRILAKSNLSGVFKFSTASSFEGKVDTDQYLKNVDYKTKGEVVTLWDKTEIYASGSRKSQYGVIIIPDYFGWLVSA